MTPIAIVHTALGATALATGAAVLMRPKGTRAHRWTGRVYAASMVALCGLAFGLRDSTPFFEGFGPFHIAAVVSLVTVALGVEAAWRKRPGWAGWHLSWMVWSYIGLVMATGGHLQRPLAEAIYALGVPTGAAIALSLLVVWGLPPAVGALWLKRRTPGWLGTAGPALGEAA